jgi:hypothetical protein
LLKVHSCRKLVNQKTAGGFSKIKRKKMGVLDCRYTIDPGDAESNSSEAAVLTVLFQSVGVSAG